MSIPGGVGPEGTLGLCCILLKSVALGVAWIDVPKPLRAGRGFGGEKKLGRGLGLRELAVRG